MRIDDTKQELVKVKGLRKYFPIVGILNRTIGFVRAVDGVDLSIQTGETFGLVGESGSGKSTIGRCIARLLDPTEGQIFFHGKEISSLPLGCLRRNMQVIFQDPLSSLNPRMTVLDIVGEPLQIHKIASRQEIRSRVSSLLLRVGLDSSLLDRFPHELSGGQAQRVGIARALAVSPRFLIADEPVSALDVSVQAQILNLLVDLQKELGLTYLFISHDLGVVKYLSQRVAVTYLGKIVELGDPEKLFWNPRHPYTQALLSAVPSIEPRKDEARILLRGEIPSSVRVPTGCRFHTRCPSKIGSVCEEVEPVLTEVECGWQVACHLCLDP